MACPIFACGFCSPVCVVVAEGFAGGRFSLSNSVFGGDCDISENFVEGKTPEYDEITVIDGFLKSSDSLKDTT